MKHKREPRGFYKNLSKHKVIIRYAATLLVENGAIDAVKRVQWYQALCLQKPLCHKRCMRTPVENHCPFLTMLKYKPCSWFNWYLKIYQLYKEKVRIFGLPSTTTKATTTTTKNRFFSVLAFPIARKRKQLFSIRLVHVEDI